MEILQLEGQEEPSGHPTDGVSHSFQERLLILCAKILIINQVQELRNNL